jgi:outer membrane protein
MFIKFNFLSQTLRYGIAEGISYAGRVPWVEHKEAELEGDNESEFLNYMEMTFDFDVGKLIRVKDLEGLYLGYLIKHRSGAKGTYVGVKEGGSNYNCIYLEKNF